MSVSGSLTFKLRDLVEINKPIYTFLRLIPTNSIKNNASIKLINSISHMYASLDKRIKYEANKLKYQESYKLGFFIHMEHGRVEFYMIVPNDYYVMYRERIIDTWNNKLTIEAVENLPVYDPNCSKSYLGYKKNDAFSLECDCRNNVLLNAILNTTHILQEDDKVGVFYNFYPYDNNPWKTRYDKAIEAYQEDDLSEKRKLSAKYIMALLCNILIKASDIVLESLSLGSSKSVKKIEKEISTETTKKRERTIVNTQIMCFSQSVDKIRECSAMNAVTGAFDCLDGDNKLIPYKYRKTTIDLTDTRIKGAETMKMMDRECQNFASLPGREILKQYKQITHTDVLETQVPKSLQSGTIGIGTNTYKGNQTNAYLPNTPNERNLTTVLIGPTRSGKTTLISNLCHDAAVAGECNINFDFCGTCETSDTLAHTPGINVLEVDCSKYELMQGLGYNEIKSAGSTFEQYRDAKVKTAQLMHLINSVNADDKDLKGKMSKHLSAVANIVFVCGGGINDVFKCLNDHKLRQKYIDMIPYNQRSNLDDYVANMCELDERNRDGTATGTKYNLITGIMDRVEKLKQNTYMELMLKKPCDKNFNLLEEIQKNQTINFRMPESMFPTQEEKDIYVTYWLTKLWIALKYRLEYVPKEQHVKVNVFIDELYQVHHAEEYIRGILSQMAKFNAKMIISCHYLNQIGIIREELKSANCSYMLIAGCDKNNYNELKEELDPYQVEDLLSLKKFHSLNLIKQPNGYVRFVTKLPPKL